MRQAFIPSETTFPGEATAKTVEEAQELCPWAAVIVEVTGGFRCFESVTDAETWKAQA